MIKVAICDDEEIFLNDYAKVINNIKKLYSYNIEIFKFNSGEELLNFISINEIKFNIIFLDIIMDKIDGIETAKKIRQIDTMTEIIFLTSSKDYALEGYEVKAYNYIVKSSDFIEYKIYEVIRDLYSRVNDFIVINNKSGIERVETNKIVYVESNKRKIIFNTIENEYEMYEKLDNIYEKLKQRGFIKVHRSYIVNREFIKKIEAKDIVTTTGEIIPISRSKLDEVKLSFMEYLEELNE
ncbi:LytTR family DNA-binding domain-containing protein [Clostridioides difficile]